MKMTLEDLPGREGHVVEAVEEHGEVLVLVLGHLQPQLGHHQPQGDQGLGEVVTLGTRHPGQVRVHRDRAEQILQSLHPRVLARIQNFILRTRFHNNYLSFFLV